jgi:hypothetical protein
MRSPRAACAAAKYLILLPLCVLPQISASEAATKCPSGQIRRVSLGICVPKAQNLAILSRRGPIRADPGEDAVAPARAAKPRHEKVTTDQADESPPVDVAERDAPLAQDQPASRPTPPAEPASSPFGSLFVGAFRSTVNAGLSAFR